MGIIHNNSVFTHLWVLCLSIALLLAQAVTLHMHLEPDGHVESTAHVHGVHPKSTLHDIDLTNHYDDHSADAVDVTPDKLPKGASFINPLAIILLFIGIPLFVSRRARVSKLRFDKTFFPRCYYLFQPPLRAPPVK